MRFKVYRLRRRGRRLPWREVINGPAFVGELISHAVEAGGERYNMLTLRPLDPMAPPLIPDLYEPVLLRFAPLAFRLRGYERVEGEGAPFSVVQEWHCEAP